MHYASLTYISTQPQHTLQSTHISVLITEFESLPGLPWVKGLIASYIWCNPTHLAPGRTRTRTINTPIERFIVRDLTNWANENFTAINQHHDLAPSSVHLYLLFHQNHWVRIHSQFTSFPNNWVKICHLENKDACRFTQLILFVCFFFLVETHSCQKIMNQ